MNEEIVSFVCKNFLVPQTEEIKHKARHYLSLIDSKNVSINEHYIGNLTLIANDR